MNYDKIIIRKQLEQLVDLLNNKRDDGLGVVHEGKGKCISNIKYPATQDGLLNMDDLLKSFGVDTIIDKNDPRLMKKTITDNIRIATNSPDFHVEIDNGTINISYTPDRMKAAYQIRDAIEKIEKGVKMSHSAEKKPLPNLKVTPETPTVIRYLKGKIAAKGIPEHEISIKPKKQDNYDMLFTISVKNSPENSTKLDSALDEINKVLRTKDSKFRTADKAIREPGNDHDTHIIVPIQENPGILLAYIKKNDPDGLPKENKPAMAII